MIITSSAIDAGGMLQDKYSCHGEEISPPLSIDHVPAEAKSLSLILEDPDAPMGTFNHWLIWNMDPSLKSIKEGQSPSGVVGQNDSGSLGYIAPCPPFGIHRYIFNVYALDIKLDLAEGAKRQELDKAMEGHILKKGELIGKYGKQ